MAWVGYCLAWTWTSPAPIVHVPTYRTDIFSEVDIAGDLMVALGIESLQPEPLAVKFHWAMPTPCDSLCFRWATWPSAWD
jgi:phenylalanyl-tRNA synthetase beta chain